MKAPAVNFTVRGIKETTGQEDGDNILFLPFLQVLYISWMFKERRMVGRTPQGWNGSIFSMIRNLSNSVVMPIAGLIITYVLCYELISMLTERNNMHDIDTWMFFKYFVKMWIAVYIVSHTFTISMAVFDVGQHVVNSASGVIGGSTAIDITALTATIDAAMVTMEIGELVLLAIELFIARLCLQLISILITVILYSRMIEIYLYVSVSPIPFATLANRELPVCLCISYPLCDPCQPGVGADWEQLPARPLRAGFPGLFYDGLCGDLCGACIIGRRYGQQPAYSPA